jgi:hypothetical protein
MKGDISDKLETKYCVVFSMGRDVFADYDTEEGFLICNAGINNKKGFTDEIVVRESLVMSCFDTPSYVSSVCGIFVNTCIRSSGGESKCVLLPLKLSVDQSNRTYDLKKHLFCHAPGSSVLGSPRSSAYRDV